MGGCVSSSSNDGHSNQPQSVGGNGKSGVTTTATDSLEAHPQFAAVKVGMKFYCLDEFTSKYTAEPMARWRAAGIKEINPHLMKILVHFDGWKDRHDIWLKLKEDQYRICPEEVLTEEQMKDGASLDEVQYKVCSYFLKHGRIPTKYAQSTNRDSLMSISHEGSQLFKLGQKV